MENYKKIEKPKFKTSLAIKIKRDLTNVFKEWTNKDLKIYQNKLSKKRKTKEIEVEGGIFTMELD